MPSTAEDPCIRESYASLGERLWRRPLTLDEVDQGAELVVTLRAQLPAPAKALEFAVASLLQSPYFLYRMERGEPDPEHPGWLRYTSYEMASRLSFGLLNTTPDAQLLNAAKKNELVDPSVVREHAERLVATPAFESSMLNVFDDYFHYRHLDELSKTEAAWTPSLHASMSKEVDMLVLSTLADAGDLRTLFTSETTFANRELAEFYGAAFPMGPSADAFVELPFPAGRAGILSTAAVLASHGSVSSSSVFRGRFIRTDLLCQEIPEPPPVIPEPEAQPDLDPTLTPSRRESTLRMGTPACEGCHQWMDPLGYAFGQFDGIGGFIADEEGKPTRNDGTLRGGGYPEELAFSGPAELAALLTGSKDFAQCLAKNFFERALQRPLAQDGSEAAALDALTTSFVNSSYSLRGLLVDAVTSDSFRLALPSSPPEMEEL